MRVRHAGNHVDNIAVPRQNARNPRSAFTDSSFFKDGFGTKEKMCCSRSLPLANKGIERNQRMPSILSRHSNVVYMVSGVTHRIFSGERVTNTGCTYRTWRRKLGVQDSVIFRNRFVQSARASGIDRREQIFTSRLTGTRDKSFQERLPMP